MIDRLLYVVTAVALLILLMFDQTFAVNLSRAFGEATPTLPFDSWVVWVGGIFAVLAAAALYRELRSR